MLLVDSTYDNIPGVFRISSSVSGPMVCISACTHGGETAGLDVIDFLVNEFSIENKLQKGSLFFMLANIDAYKKYLTTGDFKGARFVDENMNRVATEENIRNGQTSEAKRMREIEPLLKAVEYHIDIHSTVRSPASMAIYTRKSKSLRSDVVNVDEQYSDLTAVQVGRPLMDICERNGGVGIGLETGRQEDTTAYRNGIDNVLRILLKLEMLTQADVEQYLLPLKENKKIRVVDTVVVKDQNTFVASKPFSHGEMVEMGTIIAKQDDMLLIAKQKSMLIMPKSPETTFTGEEYCFLGVVE